MYECHTEQVMCISLFIRQREIYLPTKTSFQLFFISSLHTFHCQLNSGVMQLCPSSRVQPGRIWSPERFYYFPSDLQITSLSPQSEAFNTPHVQGRQITGFDITETNNSLFQDSTAYCRQLLKFHVLKYSSVAQFWVGPFLDMLLESCTNGLFSRMWWAPWWTWRFFPWYFTEFQVCKISKQVSKTTF